MASRYSNAFAKLEEINAAKGVTSPKQTANSRYSAAFAALEEKRKAAETSAQAQNQPMLDVSSAQKAPTAKSTLEIMLDRTKRQQEEQRKEQQSNSIAGLAAERLSRNTVSGLPKLPQNQMPAATTTQTADTQASAPSRSLGETRRDTRQTTAADTQTSDTDGKSFLDRLTTDLKYIGDMGKLGLESGVDALKKGTKTVASSISEFMKTLFPGKEVGDSGIKIPTLADRTRPKLQTYADSMENGLQTGGTPVQTAAEASTNEIIRSLNEFANENTRQKKLEELQKKYSDEDIGVVTKALADGANSIGYNLPAQAANLLTMGVGGALVMGTQSFADAYTDAKNDGASNRDALEYAAKEAINQGILDSLFGAFGESILGTPIAKAGAKIANPTARALFDVGTNAIGEGAEEMLQSLVSTVNRRTTYDPDATVDPSSLAYEGLLGGLMGGFYGAASLPGRVKAYRADYNLVNEFSKRAAKVADNTEAETVLRVGETLMERADAMINDKNSSTEDVARATYIKNGLSESVEILSGYKDRIILDNTEKNDVVTDIIYQPADDLTAGLAQLVDRVAEDIEPDANAVNSTIDFLRDKIDEKNTALLHMPASEQRRATEIERLALIEMDKTLRENRAEIEAKRTENHRKEAIANRSASSPQISDVSAADLSVGDVILYEGKRREIEQISDRSITMKDLDAPDYGGVLAGTSDVLAYDGWKEDMNEKGFEILSKAKRTPETIAEKQTTEQAVVSDSRSKTAEPPTVEPSTVEPSHSMDGDSAADVGKNSEDHMGKLTDAPDTAILGEESAPVLHDFSLAYRHTKHTETGAPLHVFSIDGRLSKEEYASLKSRMKEIGGFYSKFVKGFIVPSDQVDAVSSFANVSEVPAETKPETVSAVTENTDTQIPDSGIELKKDNKKTVLSADHAAASPAFTSVGNDVNSSPAAVVNETTEQAPTTNFDRKGDQPLNAAPSASTISQNAADVNNPTAKRQQALAEGVIPESEPEATTNISAPDVGKGLSTETAAAEPLVNTSYGAIADRVLREYIEPGKSLTMSALQEIATSVYGGTLAEGAFTPKDMTDALELAVNHHIIRYAAENTAQLNGSSAKNAVNGIAWAEHLLSRIPTQTKRTDEQLSLQQFSTPPNIAYLANWLANIGGADFMLEPSAGIGGLASFAKGFGATTAVNEISERRLGALRALGFDHVFSEDAAQLDNILPDYVKPTVVVMNPPFSSTGGRTKNSAANAKPHVEQALSRLEDGGRLVAILGQGMSNDAPMFAGWWDNLRKDYTIRANLGIDGTNYKKYGTTFNVRLVVIDKTGPQTGETITGDYKALAEIPAVLEGVRNDRTHRGTTESNPAVADGEGTAERTGRISETGRTVSDPVSPGNDHVLGSVRTLGGRQSDSGVGRVRRGSAVRERVQSDAGAAVQSNNEQSGERGRTSGHDENVARMVAAESRSGGSDRSDLAGRGSADGHFPVDGGQPGNAEVDRVGRGGSGGRRVNPPKAGKKKANVSDDGIYAGYVPSKLAVSGAKPHPAVLVESSAMAAVASPEITYAPHIAKDIIENGLISDVQLENISYAGQAHEQMLENGVRKGYFIGDGTGVGKGRQAAGIILDNFNQGRTKALWISEKDALMEDARRDWGDIGGNPDDIFPMDGVKKGIGRGRNKRIPDSGILFVTYTKTRSGPKGVPTTNADTIIDWLGKDFDGVIIYDEAHNMNSLIPQKGSRGTKTPAQKAIEANKIQEALPNARVVYMSATGATEVGDLCFASRLGLWGKGTQFTDAQDFSAKIGASGVAGMELVATSLKSMGVYQARSISFEGVRYDSVRHTLTKQQRQIYDTMSEAWQVTLQNMEQAIRATGIKNTSTARSNFYSSMQNFYNQVLSSMAAPSVIEDIKKELDAGHSCVIQLTNTNESQQEKELSRAKAEGQDLEELDVTPRGALLNFLENSFPVQQYEEYLDSHGNKQSRPVVDSQGNPVLNRQAVAARDGLIARINEMSIPEGPIDMILNAFGADNVAEVTGRSRRVVSKPDETGTLRKVEETLGPEFRIAETNAFQNGEKRILIFSNAGSTGRSYHADKRAKNQQQRIHYILQPGWNAKTATQGFGRTHRSNQVQPPVYKLVSTNIEGQKRFVTSIARRLDQLGALTKGQRQTGSGIFGEKDNLESPLSRDALREFYKRLGKEQIQGVNGREVFTKLGLYRNFYDEYGNFTLKSGAADDITTFLNRLLALKVDEQNIVFGEFESIRQQMYDAAIEAGTLDTGISNVKADKITVNQEETIYTDEKTVAETKYVKATAYRRTTPIATVGDAMAFRGQFQGIRRMEDGSVRAVYRIADETDALGRVNKRFLLQSPNRSVQSRYNEANLTARTREIPEAEWDAAWAEEVKNLPEFNESTLHMITGAILPVWNRLPQDGNTKAMKIVTDDGSQILGRIIPENRIAEVLRGMNIRQKAETYTGAQLYDAVMKSGKEVSFSQSYSGRNTIKRSRVAGENRLEITGTNLWALKEDFPEIITETIQYRQRYFIPTGEKGRKILDGIVSKYSVELSSKDENSLFFSKTGGKWGKGDQKGNKIKSVSDLKREATRIFGVQIGTGKVGKSGAAGVYNTHANTIRTRMYGDIPTISHELGHWLDNRYRLSDAPEVDELIALYRADLEEADYNESVFPNEAVAYYLADLLRDKTSAEEKAPEFSRFLDGELSAADKKRLAEYTDMTNAYHAADAIRRRNAQIHYRHKDHSSLGKAQFQIDEFLRNPANYMGKLSKRFVRAWIDDIVDLRKFGKTYDFAMRERTANSIAAGRLNIAFTDNHGEILGRSLSAILAEGNIDDRNHTEFNAYLVARAALDRVEAAERGEKVQTLVYADAELQSKESLVEALGTYETENPDFPAAAKGVYEYRNNLLDIAVESGILSERLAEYFKKTFPHYVPLYRVMDDRTGISSGAGKKTPTAPIARFKGSGRDVYAPIENLAVQTSLFTRAILQNDTRRAFADYIDNHEGMGGFAEKIPESKIYDTVTTDEIGMRLSRFDSDKLAGMSADERTELFEELMTFIGDTTGMWKASSRQGENVVSVLRNGRREYYEVHDKDLMNALLTMNPRQCDAMMNLFGTLTKWFKVLTTGDNPRFGFTNIPRDLQSGYISSDTTNNPLKYGWDFAKAFAESITESNGYKEYLRNGGGYQGAFTVDMRNMKREYNNLVQRHSAVKKTAAAAVGMIPRLIDAGESASRYAEFKRARKLGMDGLEALRKSQEVTVNFQRHGTWGSSIDKVLPYFNASLQSLYHFYDVLTKGDAKQRTAKWIKFLGANLAMAALVLVWNYDRDEEAAEAYENLSTYNKNAYWCFYIGKGEFFRIAKPKDMMAPSNIVSNLFELQVRGNPSAFYNFSDYLKETFFPPALGDTIVFGTWLDLAKNETFTGAPIVSSAYEGLDKTMQYNEKTSKLGILLGSALNLSPMQIDYVIDDTAGFVGDFLLNLTRQGGAKWQDTLDLNDRGIPNVLAADSVYSTDIVSIFYDTKEKYDAGKASYKSGNDKNGKYTAYDIYGSYKYGKVADLYGKVNGQIKTADDEDEAREIRATLNALMKSVNETEATDVDRAVSEISENSGYDVSDIAPFLVVPEKLTEKLGNDEKKEYAIDAYDMMQYYTESQIVFEAYYPRLIDSGYDDESIAEAMKLLKKEVKKQMDARFLEILKNR